MNVLAIYVANELLQAEREKAAERRFAMSWPPGPACAIGSRRAAGLRRLVGSPVQSTGVLPKLEDYPYRS